MNKMRLAVVVVLSQIIQATFLSRLHIFGATPNLNIALTLILALFYGPIWGRYTGLGLGLLEDIMFAPVLGVKALIYFLIGHGVGRAMKNNAAHLPTGIALTFLATFFSWFVTTLICLVIRLPFSGLAYWRGPLFVEGLLNSILYLLGLFILGRLIPPHPVRKFTGL